MRFARPLLLGALLPATAVGLTLSVVAAAGRADPRAQEAPDPLPLLERLPGRWKGEQTAGGAHLLENVEWKQVLQNRFLECRLEASDPITGNLTYEGIGFLRHDPVLDEYSFHWFDSNGRTERYLGRAVGETIELDAVESAGIDRLVFRPEERGYACEAGRLTEGEALVQVFESRYRRESQDEDDEP